MILKLDRPIIAVRIIIVDVFKRALTGFDACPPPDYWVEPMPVTLVVKYASQEWTFF